MSFLPAIVPFTAELKFLGICALEEIWNRVLETAYHFFFSLKNFISQEIDPTITCVSTWLDAEACNVSWLTLLSPAFV